MSGCKDNSSKYSSFVLTVLYSGLSLKFIELRLKVRWSPTKSDTAV